MNIVKNCPMCGVTLAFGLTDDEYVAFRNKGQRFIQDVLPHFDKVEREFLKTGYCPDCQSLIFGSSYEMNEKWIDISALV